MSTEKLLTDEEQSIAGNGNDEHRCLNETQKTECLRNTKAFALVVGFVVGNFIQFSSLAMNFFLKNKYVYAEAATENQLPMPTYAIASCLWSLFSSLGGVGLLLLMRGMMITSFYSANSFSDDDPKTLREKEDFMLTVTNDMEKYFSVGTLGGVALAWIGTDLALGLRPPIGQNLIVFVIAGVWYSMTPKNSHD